MTMTHGLKNGASSRPYTKSVGHPLLAQSSNHSEAKINAAARATYSVLMGGAADYDKGSVALKHKSRQIAIAVLDSADIFEDHYP